MVDVKPNKQVKNKGGRPKLKIDYQLIEGLSHIHCTQGEIATALGISVRTLQRDKEFCHIYKKGIESAKTSLRRLQWKSAEGVEPQLVLDSLKQPVLDLKGKVVFTLGLTPNVTMQIWLGKQYLEQRDIQELTGVGGGAIKAEIIVVSNKARKLTKNILKGKGTGEDTDH